MAVLGLSATSDYQRGAFRAPNRRAPSDVPLPLEPEAVAPPAPEAVSNVFPLDVAFYASRFRADLVQLSTPAEPEQAAASEAGGDPALFDFFGNLSVLLLAVRAGDLGRAQAAADALEMEVLVERSAGRQDLGSAHRLEDLGRLLGAARSHDESAARAAAKDLAAEFASALAPKALAIAPPPDPYAEAELSECGGAAYDTLAHYCDVETRTV